MAHLLHSVTGDAHPTPNHPTAPQTDVSPEAEIAAAPEPAAVSASDIAELRDRVEQLARLFEERIAQDEVRRVAFDRLYQELDQYKRDFILARMKSMFGPLLAIYDGLIDYASYLESAESVEVADVHGNIELFREELLEALGLCGVALVHLPDRALDPRFQKVLGTVPITEPAEADRVVRVHRAGFLLGERLLRPESVTVTRLVNE